MAIDHLIPLRSFDDLDQANDPSNLAALCVACHGAKTSGPERRWMRGDALDLIAFIRSLDLEPVRLSR